MTEQSQRIDWSRVDTFPGNFTSPALQQYRACPVCGSLREHTVLSLDDFQFYSDSNDFPKRFQIRDVQCLDCYAFYLNPQYSDLGFRILFQEAGQSYGSSEGRPAEQIAWLESFGLLKDGTSYLDVGCYEGRFLGQLPNRIRRIGVDIDAPAIARGQRRYGADGVELVCGDLEQFDCPTTPDVVAMFHVLEHVARPVKVLQHLRQITKPSSRLVIEVPVLEHGASNDINGFLSVQHQTHFSRRSLASALARAGWRILKWHQATEYNGCRVLAEPSDGIIETKGDPHDFRLFRQYLTAWYSALVAVEERLTSIPDCDRVVVWGGGAHTEFMYHVTSFFHAAPGRTYLIVDSDPLKQGKTWRGISILSPAVLANIDWTQTALVISSYGSQNVIADAASKLTVPESRIVRIYDGLRVY